MKETGTVAVVGGGPVGLFLALFLVKLGIPVEVLEKRDGPRAASRSIGIHPPSLEMLDQLGLANSFVSRGVCVRRVEAHGEKGLLGILEFRDCQPPFRYVLTLPQDITEQLLRDALQERAPGCLRSADVLSVFPPAEGEPAGLQLAGDAGERRAYAAIIGCDGKGSVVRRSAGIAFEGSDYPGEYAMADFPDTTGLGSTAAIYLDRQGLLESFPLPTALRRWVARCDRGAATRTAELVARVEARTGVALDPANATHPSTFRAQRFQASAFARGTLALAGDAAHVVSPIGGQGMNLGWLGARSLAQAIAGAWGRGEAALSRALASDAVHRRRIATTAARRAELNMWLGSPDAPRLRDPLLATLIGTRASFVLARAFSMRGLSLGV